MGIDEVFEAMIASAETREAISARTAPRSPRRESLAQRREAPRPRRSRRYRSPSAPLRAPPLVRSSWTQDGTARGNRPSRARSRDVRGPAGSRGATRAAPRSVPLAAREAAEGDEAYQDDDQPDPEAPDEDQDDPNDDDDAAEGYPCDSTTLIRSSHSFLLHLRFARPACFYPRAPGPTAARQALPRRPPGICSRSTASRASERSR